jgi:hypothetical protein
MYTEDMGWQGARGGILMILILAALLIAGGYFVGKTILNLLLLAEAKHSISECVTWQEWEHDYPQWDPHTQTGYFVTRWQKEQCDAVGVTLEAHVREY